MYKKIAILLFVSFSEICMGSVYKSATQNRNLVFDKTQFDFGMNNLIILPYNAQRESISQQLVDANNFYERNSVYGKLKGAIQDVAKILTATRSQSMDRDKNKKD